MSIAQKEEERGDKMGRQDAKQQKKNWKEDTRMLLFVSQTLSPNSVKLPHLGGAKNNNKNFPTAMKS